MRLILIYRPSEGGRLSRPRHSVGAAYRSDFRENTETKPQRGFDPGTSHSSLNAVSLYSVRLGCLVARASDS